VDDRDVGTLGARALARLRRGFGVVTQPGRLLADRTALGNVSVVLRALGAGRAAAREQALAALDAAGLRSVRNALPHELADSERGRLLLARALAGDPWLVLADEPAAMLPHAVPEVAALLRGAQARGATCVIATQSPTLAHALDGRVLRLVGGRLEPEGTPG
jgi:ABC-type ATPase involved in cell division